MPRSARADPAPLSIPTDFADRLLAWHLRHGRHDLPWQHRPTPYRVWVSEVMLQQTQVSTVIPYFKRFISRFPTVGALANADLEVVLGQWSGLGYYARARNLHRAARVVRDEHRGRLPRTADALRRLPGIGRSTAAAILALACNQHHAILDGNVKRVLSRHRGIDGWAGRAAVTRRLWALAEALTPASDTAAYTQAIMDIGATLCTRTRPNCNACPLCPDCIAHADGRTGELPARRPRRPLPERSALFLIIEDAERRVLFERRPPVGIWGGLWSLPECPPGTDVRIWCRDRFGVAPGEITPLPELRHTFSHFHLEIRPRRVILGEPPNRVMEGATTHWYSREAARALGLPAPVRKLLGISRTA